MMNFRFLPLLLLAITPGIAAADPPTDAQIAAWVTELNADDYFARERATESLQTAGAAAVPALVEAAKSSELETTARSISILGRMALNGDDETAQSAEQALDALAKSAEAGVVARVKTALRERQAVRREDALVKLNELGANLQMEGERVATVLLRGDLWRGTSADLQSLRWFPEVHSLICRDVELDDMALEFLNADNKLQFVSLVDVKATDQALAPLGRLKNLVTLYVVNVPISDASMPMIGQFKQLQTLYLSNLPVTNAGIEHLVHLRGLQMLRLDRLPISNASLRVVSQLTSLKNLQLNHLPLTNDVFKDLGSLVQLRQLWVKYCPVEEQTLAPLERCPNLLDLRLFGTKITAETADAFAAAHPAITVDHRAGGLLGVQGDPHPAGTRLLYVQEGMGAAKAGIAKEDILTHFNGEPIRDFDSLRALIRDKTPGEVVEVRGLRDGKEYTKQVALSEEEQ